MIGKLLAGFGTVGYLGSAVSYHLAGIHYRKMKERKGEIEPISNSKNRGPISSIIRWFDKKLEDLLFGDYKGENLSPI